MDKRKSKDKQKAGVDIIDLNNYRKNKQEERKREYERVLFHRILGVYSFAEKDALHHVEVLDVSFSGIKFREKNPEKPITIGQKIALRFYFTPTTYLRAVVDVKRVIPFKDNDVQGLEYGCELDKNTKSYEVLKSLVQFMQKYSEIACTDAHPPLIWF